MRKQEALYLIPATERGNNTPVPYPKTYEYFFSENERQKMLQDPKCNPEIFTAAVQEKDDIRTFEGNEHWYIGEKELRTAGLTHWTSASDDV